MVRETHTVGMKTETQTNSQTERQTESETDRQMIKETGRHRDKQVFRTTERKTGLRTDETKKKVHRLTYSDKLV